jgi:hypothetical protein
MCRLQSRGAAVASNMKNAKRIEQQRGVDPVQPVEPVPDAVTLRADADGIVVSVDARHGGAIRSITTPTGHEVLWRMPDHDDRLRALAPRDQNPDFIESKTSWLADSKGGWEIMAPNAGDAGVVDGRFYPFHGVAGRGAWSRSVQTPTAVSLQTESRELAFRSVRSVDVDRDGCTVTERLTSTASSPRQIAWGSHLAFGRDMLDGEISLETTGTILGGSMDGAAAGIPALAEWFSHPRDGTELMAYVAADGEVGRAVVTNTTLGLRAVVTWDAAVFPYLWVWGELGGTRGWPWFGRARALGIEPVSSWPSVGVAALREGNGSQIVLAPGEEKAGRVELRLEWPPKPVQGKASQHDPDR